MNAYPPRQIYAGTLTRRQHTWGRRSRRRRVLQLPWFSAVFGLLALAALLSTLLVAHVGV